MNIQTHQGIDTKWCGLPRHVGDGESRIDMSVDKKMAVDETGLIHGGFIFGLADHAAMLAVNHPNVVLGSAEVTFLKPVIVGDTVSARAEVTDRSGKKNVVSVSVTRDREPVFNGTFTCFVLDKHVLG